MSYTRGDLVVVTGPGDAEAVRAHTPATVPVVEHADRADVAAPADLVFVAPGVRVGDGWLDGLREALGTDGTAATVDAVTVEGDALVPALARLRPRADAPAWACTLVTRAALDLAGPLDDDFAARCRAVGLLHVVAGEVVVRTPAPPDLEGPEPVAWARRRPQDAAGGMAITFDARILREPIAGTQVHTLELLAALHRTQALRLRVLLPPDPTPTALAALEPLDGLERLDAGRVDTQTPSTPLVHRPYQVSSAIDLATLRQVGARLVVTHQDLLNFHQRAYHRDQETWEHHRRLTRLALGAAHGVVAFSHHAAADLVIEELVRPDRLSVVEIGVDHRLAELVSEPRRPDLNLGEGPFLLCLGTDLRHKNRPFALALTRALRDRGWEGRLVLAGPHAALGSSSAEEAALLAGDADLRAAVIDGGVPDEAEKAWLYAHAAAVVYPTVYEGFGLVPFEAAEHGTPCLFAPQAALAETLRDGALLVPWDAEASADRALEVLTAGAARERHLAAVRTAARRYTWDRAAQGLLDVYARTLAVGYDGEDTRAALEAEAQRGHWEGMYWKLYNDVGPAGLTLVGPDGVLPENARLSLAALAARPLTRRPLLSLLNAVGRLSRR